MRYLIIVKASRRSEAGEMPEPVLRAAMARYHEALAQAGVLLDAGGLRPSREGWRVRYREGQRMVVDGPFADTRDLVAGYTLIQVRSKQEALEWVRRFPAPHGAFADGEIEVRPLSEREELEPGPPTARLRGVQH